MTVVDSSKAIKLREAGYPQEGENWWCVEICTCKYCNRGSHQILKQGNTDGVIAFAPTMEDLRKHLPQDAEIVKHECTDKCTYQYRGEDAWYAISKSKQTATHTSPYNDVGLLAELWLALREKGLV